MKLKSQKNLFLLCGTPGAGKSTWVRKQLRSALYDCVHVSRDAIRFSKLGENEDYFAHETEVFNEFCQEINNELNTHKVVFADATHLTPKSRAKTLDKLNLNGVNIYAVNFNLPLETCLEQNELRQADKRAYVPRSAIRRMYNSYVPPTMNEKYHYEKIINIG